MARRQLQAKGIPISFWANIVNCSNYLLNLFPTKAVWDMTPFKKWNERKPLVEHLKMFGCIAWTHIADDKRKLDVKSHTCIMMGYSEESNA